MVEEREDEVEKLLRECDDAIQTNRGLGIIIDGRMDQLTQSTTKHKSDNQNNKEKIENWDEIISIALGRIEDDGQSNPCPICLSLMILDTRDKRRKRRNQPKKVKVTSCSHLFHSTCLSKFEDLSSFHGIHLCPLCRSEYFSIDL